VSARNNEKQANERKERTESRKGNINKKEEEANENERI